MIRFLRKRSKYDWIAYSCYAFMIAVILGEGYWNHARAGDVQWNIQLHWQTPHQGPTTGNIGTPPHHTHGRHLNHHYHPNGYNSLNHMHHYDGRYGWHYHQGRRYNVVHEFHNHYGEYCREFEMNIYIGGYPQLAWGVACRNRAGFWRLMP